MTSNDGGGGGDDGNEAPVSLKEKNYHHRFIIPIEIPFIYCKRPDTFYEPISCHNRCLPIIIYVARFNACARLKQKL